MSNGFPPPSPEQPQPRAPEPSPWAHQPWAAPAAPPRKQRTGLIVTLAVGGGLVAVGAMATLVYALLQTASDSIALPPERSPAPHSTASAAPGAGADAEAEPGGPAVEGDVTITACTRDSVIGWQSADVKVVNGSASAADYVISVEFLDRDGTTVAEGVTGVVGLAPGKAVAKKVQGLGEVPHGTTCRINDLSRTPSTG
ncbi:hypothetical protein [Streptomyces sp. cmx-18-6]|uniref:hypothetical protein n=1 Tax=Streptomyces sp. cmx-18-6 TaxID=2790930 RepID=UPI00397EC954